MLPKVLSYNCVTFRNAICMWGYYNDLLGEGGGGGARGKVAESKCHNLLPTHYNYWWYTTNRVRMGTLYLDLWFMATRNCAMLPVTKRQLRRKVAFSWTDHIPNVCGCEKGLKNNLLTLREVQYPMESVYGLRVTSHSPSGYVWELKGEPLVCGSPKH